MFLLFCTRLTIFFSLSAFNSLCTAVKQAPHDGKALGSYPAECWAFLVSIFFNFVTSNRSPGPFRLLADEAQYFKEQSFRESLVQ